MRFVIYVIISILIFALLIFILVTLAKKNSKLKKDVKELRETNNFLVEQQKKVNKKKEEIDEEISSFHDSNGDYDINAANDFLQKLSENRRK